MIGRRCFQSVTLAQYARYLNLMEHLKGGNIKCGYLLCLTLLPGVSILGQKVAMILLLQTRRLAG